MGKRGEGSREGIFLFDQLYIATTSATVAKATAKKKKVKERGSGAHEGSSCFSRTTQKKKSNERGMP